MRVLLPLICSGQARRADGSNSPTVPKPRRTAIPPARSLGGGHRPRIDPHISPIRAEPSCKEEPQADGGGRNPETDFHGEKRSNDTHASTTDPDARLYRKGPGKEAKLCFMGHALMENRNGLLVDACLTRADGHAERITALHRIEPRADWPQAITVGADKAYDAEDFVNEPRSMKATARVAQNTNGRWSAIDGRTTRHAGYAVSQRIRKRIEEAFGWMKTIGGQEKAKFRGRDRVGWAFTVAAAAYNLVRLPKLIAEST